MIYLDYTANTPADPDVLDAYLAAERRYIANPNSTHIAGQEARAEMERVTQSIAQHLGVQPAEIIYWWAPHCRLLRRSGTRPPGWTLAATAG